MGRTTINEAKTASKQIDPLQLFNVKKFAMDLTYAISTTKKTSRNLFTRPIH